jgi:hypothetical protein
MTDMKADHWFFPTYRALLGHIVPPLTLFYWGSKPCVLKQRKLHYPFQGKMASLCALTIRAGCT